MINNSEFYLEIIRIEIEKLEEEKFTGNIEFQMNFKEGSIANCNITFRKSIKKQ